MGGLHGPAGALGSALDRRWSVVKYAVVSRAIVLVLGVVSNAIISDYDASTGLVLPDTSSALESVLRTVTHVFVRWDSFYFLHIADAGYAHEQEHAFFPLLPLLMRLVAGTVLMPLAGWVDRRIVLAIAGLVISNISFVFAAATLYVLGRATLRNERLAYVAALLFVAAPASAFMSAVYTESLFAWLVFSALLLIAQRQYAWAALCLSASGLCRSNGILYAGFFVWDLVVCSDAWRGRHYAALAIQAVRAAVLVAVSTLGFAAFQAYGHRTFCQPPAEAAAAPRPYCHSALSTVYGFVQAEYWDVGFLKYYTVQQLPNFALAAPMVALSLAGLYTYAAYDPLRVATLGWRQRRAVADGKVPLAAAFFRPELLPHVYLWALLLAVATTTMHVQVVTRFFSSVPVVFWFAAHAATGGGWWQQRAVVGCFVAYGLAGVVLFSNFFPPA
ncbi:ER membrane glycoprotein subunit of the GPI transamidase complex-like protein [Coemansia linderi]|uniref:ER membrane glycoprotein subunit of the GPI transamidase complex-like protein n=1 Tax=Coemansia linderi TaxID=2663919 RepID=A0ACC1K9V6_9FUNG|nr:ER membrane glycoprotein subunit of the GPI transamidase complex-like protein [Coemansia linderi]